MSGLFSRIDTIIVRVRDILMAKQWYSEVLELKPTFEQLNGNKIIVFEVGDRSPITIYEILPGEELPSRNFATGYPIFWVENRVEEVHSILQNRGVEVEEIQIDGSIKFFRFYDPDENELQVCGNGN